MWSAEGGAARTVQLEEGERSIAMETAGVSPALQLHGRIYSAGLGLGNLNQQSTGKWHISLHTVSMHCKTKDEG